MDLIRFKLVKVKTNTMKSSPIPLKHDFQLSKGINEKVMVIKLY